MGSNRCTVFVTFSRNSSLLGFQSIGIKSDKQIQWMKGTIHVKKAVKFDEIFAVDLMFTKLQIDKEDFVKFCGLLRIL